MRATGLLLLLTCLRAAAAAPDTSGPDAPGTQAPAISSREFTAHARDAAFAPGRETEPDGFAHVTLSDGTVLMAYVAPAESGAQLFTARVRNGSRKDDVALARQPRGSVASRPRLASDGSRVACTWIEISGERSRVLASFSPDAGARWLAAVPVNETGVAVGSDVVLLSDSSLLVVWLETNGSLRARRISPEYRIGPAVEIAPASTASPNFPPTAVLLRDYTGGRTSAEVLVGHRFSGPSGEGVRVRAVTIPEGEFLVRERNCDCAPRPEDLRGFPIRAEVTGADPATNRVTLTHAGVPGVLEPGTDLFAIAPLDLARLHTGGTLLGRIERGADGGWRILEFTPLGMPAPARGR